METKEFNVTGMKCEMCEAKLEEALKGLNGVSAAKADHDACNVKVDYDPAAVTPEQMKEAVDDLGRFEMNLG